MSDRSSPLLRFFKNSALILIIVSFVAWGGYGLKKTDSWVIKIGDQEYSLQEWQQLLRDEMHARDISTQDADPEAVKDELLDKLINRAVLSQESAKNELFISDDIIKSYISNMSIFKSKDGNFDKEIFKNILSRVGESAFVSKVRQEAMVTQLLSVFWGPYQNNIQIAPQITNDMLQKAYATKIVSAYSIMPKDLHPTPPSIHQKDLQKFFNENTPRFIVPEKRDLSYIVLDGRAIEVKVTVSEEDVLAEYKKNKKAFFIPETVDFVQIVVKSEKKAEEVLRDLRKGTLSLKGAIAKFHEKSYPSELMSVSEEGLDPRIKIALFGLKVRTFSQPLQTPLGWHIFFVKQINKPRYQSLEEMRGIITKQIAEQRKFEEVTNIAKKIDATLTKQNTIDQIKGIAKEYSLTVQTKRAFSKNLISKSGSSETVDSNNIGTQSDPIQVDATQDDVTTDGNFLSAAFSVEEGRLSNVIPLANGYTFVVLGVSQVTKSYLPEFANIKDKVLTIYKNDKEKAALLDLIQKERSVMAESLHAKSGSIDGNGTLPQQISLGAKVKSSGDGKGSKKTFISALYKEEIKIKPGKRPPGLTEPLYNEIMQMDEKRPVSQIYETRSMGYAFAVYEKTNFLNEDELEELKATLSSNMSQKYKEMAMEQYVFKIRSKYKVEIKRKLL